MSLLSQRIVAGAVGGLGLAALCAFIGHNTNPLMPTADAQAKKKYKYFGSATCAGASCHGAGKEEKDRPATEYTTWTNKDRHAKAFNTLYNEDSTAMAEELKIAEAAKSDKCLSCHTTQVPKALQGDKYNSEDGVSCDGCHGPAEGWFKPHTVKGHKYEDMLKLGMWDTRNMWRRADMCVSCHLQIEPELVDAGHPDLSFEIFQHSLREPPHWFERQSWDGVRSWAVGQAVSIRESLNKLAKRIKKKQGKDAIEIAAAQASSYLTVFRHGVAEFGTKEEQASAKKLDSLLNAQKLDGKKLHAACTEGAKLMDGMGKRLAKSDVFSKEKIASLWKKITTDKATLGGIDEFGAEQVAGAVLALYNSYKVGAGPRLKAAAETPDAIKKILVRPTVYQPEDMFDDDGYFKDKEWNKRFKAVLGLVK